jgi:hypothetical protein
MKTKKTAFLFLLVANLVLLVHAVIPHHHHSLEICITDSNCQDACENHEHSNSNCDHTGNETDDCCVLNQLILLPGNNMRQETNCTIGDDFNPPFDSTPIILSYTDFNVGPKNIKAKVPIPVIQSAYTQFVVLSSGLRAPPVV